MIDSMLLYHLVIAFLLVSKTKDCDSVVMVSEIKFYKMDRIIWPKKITFT